MRRAHTPAKRFAGEAVNMDMLATLQRALTALKADRTDDNRHAGSAEPMRILVVDDDQDVLAAAEAILRSEGYLPISTSAPQAALQIARSMRPNAIFLDVLMPGFDGWDVLAALKADPATTAIPVMMICMLGERAQALTAGAHGVISKPLDAAKVRAAMAGIAEARPLKAAS
ncbi:MAG: response regulator [Hyphomicrobiales bacterium]|nr:MAG: response regulator [Hyphomicrobiales bacterium]